MGVSLQTVQRWVDAGLLKAWRTPGGHRRIDAVSADAWVAERLLPVSTRARQATGGRPGAPPGCALVVDDNAIDRELMADHVKSCLPELHIEQASNGFQALLLIGQLAPQVVITDIHMPHMDGFEMIRQLRAAPRLMPRTLVAVSAHSEDDLASRGTLPPEVLFLRKPLDAQRLHRHLLLERDAEQYRALELSR